MRKTVIAGLALLCLCGCTSNPKRTLTVCRKEGGSLEEEVTLLSQGDVLLAQCENDAYRFEDLGIKKSDLDDENLRKQLVEDYQKVYDLGDCLEVTMNITNTHVVFTITLDYTKADYARLFEMKVLDEIPEEYISFHDKVQHFENESSLTCTSTLLQE